MEFIFIFAIVLVQMLFINLFEVIQIIRTFRIYTFMDDEVFTVFLVNTGASHAGQVQCFGISHSTRLNTGRMVL